MANDRVKYLFVKRKMSNVTLSTFEAEHKKTIPKKIQCKCNNKIENKLNKNETRVKRDSEIVNTTVDHDYDMLVKTLSLIVNAMKINRNKKRRKYKVYRYCKKEIINLLNSLNGESYGQSNRDSCGVNKTHSTPIVKYNATYIDNYLKRSKSYSESQNKIRFNTDFIVNSCCKTCNVPECINPFINPMVQARVYQCQLNSLEDNCCCSCNSDAMFEVMKSLYDCYKKRNCDNCDCILCGHLPCEDRKLVGTRKSGVDVGVTTTDSATRKEKLDKAKTEGLLTPLEGKSSAQREKILKGLAKAGLPLPDGKSSSEKKIIQKVRLDMGLPPEPKSDESKEKYAKALAAGIITPLEGKTPAQKEHVLRRMAKAGISMPEGRTPSEKAFISKIKDATSSKGLPGKFPSEKLRQAQAEGLLTPLDGKSPKKKEKILKGLAKLGMPLPEGKTPSEKILIQKIRKDMGLPPEGKTESEKRKLAKAHAAGIISPLEGKSADDKKKILKRMADARVPLPEGRTPSEKALIDKIRDETAKTPVDKLDKAKAQGLLTPLKGKSSEQKENILKGLAKLGLPLPEGKTPSEKNIIKKVRDEIGYPAEPTSKSEKEKLAKTEQHELLKAITPSEKLKKAKAEGFLTSLDGKSANEKEKILKGLAKAGLPLPEGKTPSEKKLIKKIRSDMGLPEDPKTLSQKQKIENAHAIGIITPLEGKTQAQKESILRKLADAGVPLPKGRTASEKSLIAKTKAEKAKAQGLLTPLEGKHPVQQEKILKGLVKLGLPLPEGKTPSEKKLIEKVKKDMGYPPRELVVPSEKLRRAKDEGLLTPLDGKSPEKKEKILRGLAKAGLPLPEGKTPSEKKIVQKVRHDMGLPVEHKIPSEKKRLAKAYAVGIVSPLEGKSPASKENILRRLADADVLLPEGRTPSEKALIDRVKATTPKSLGKLPSGKLRKAKAEGLLTPLKGKSSEQREKILRGLAKLGLPLPESSTPSEKKIIKKVRYDMGYPISPRTTSEKQKLAKAHEAGIVQALEGKMAPEKEAILKKLIDAGVRLPEGRTPSEKALIEKLKAPILKTSMSEIPSDKIKKAKALGLLTPLEGKSPQQKQKILKGLGKMGLPLPEGKTPSDKKLILKVRNEIGYPSEPQTSSERQRLAKAHAAGIVTPLEGKTPAEKEVILKKLAQRGVPLPEGQSPSEKALIDRVKLETPRLPAKLLSDIMTKDKAQGLLTSLEGKPPQEQEKILRGLAKLGLPLPEGKSPSEKKLIQKVRHDIGYPMDPKTISQKQRLATAHAAGIVAPLEGKTNTEKEAILKKLNDANVLLPEGRTQSEKALIAKLKASAPRASDDKLSTEKIKKAKELGLLTPLEGKPLSRKEEILKGLAKLGLPLPEGKTTSDKNLIKKVRNEVGYPLEPRTSSEKQKLAKAHAAGLITPLQGKKPAEKETILKKIADMGVQLPEGRTPSEKALIAKIKAETRPKTPSDKLKKARDEGLLTPLQGKTEKQKEKILRGVAKIGLPLPEGKSSSEKLFLQKFREDMGLPAEPKTQSEIKNLEQAYAAGIVTPLKGKTPSEKEVILQKLAEAGVPLPEGQTTSDKDLISKIRKAKEAKLLPETSGRKIPSEKLRKARAEGLLTPLDGKTRAQKEKILRGLATAGFLPEGKTQSEKKLMKKIRNELGLPPEATSPSEKDKMAKAHAAGIIIPLEGKTSAEKEAILKKMADAGIPLPEGRTPSERAVIAKLKKVDLISPLDGKTPTEKEKILNGLISAHLPLPEGKTKSEKALIRKLKANAGIPPEGATPSENEIIRKAKADGLFTPIKGKLPEQKEKIIKGLIKAGLPIPEGETSSEKSLIKKLKIEAGLPPEPVLSEKIGKMKTRSKKNGVTDAEYEDILKSTKCDQSCGCDKKKIRFKHSYIKIRVTSPDISSFCPCPDECLPGVKGGVFIDNEGINVTVGTAVGVPVLGQCYSNRNTFSKDLQCSSVHINNASKIEAHEINNDQDNEQILLSAERSDSTKTVKRTMSGARIYRRHTVSQIYTYPNYVVNNNMINHTGAFRGKISEPCIDVLSNHSMSDLVDFPSSDESMLLMNSDSSVTLTTISSNAAYSATSGISSVALTSSLSAKSSKNDDDKDIEREYLTKENVCSGFRTTVARLAWLCWRRPQNYPRVYSNNVIKDLSKSPLSSCTSKSSSLEYDTLNGDVIILRISDKEKKRGFFKRNKKETKKSDKNVEITKRPEPIVVINDINTFPMSRDVMKKITEILAAKPIDDDSSVFVLVPSDDINNDTNEPNMHIMQNIYSTVGLQISDDRPQIDDNTDPSLKPLCEVYIPKRFIPVPSSRGIKFCTKPKGEKSKDTFTNKIDDPCENVNEEKELAQSMEHNKKDSSKDVCTSNDGLINCLQQINDYKYDNSANVKLTSKRCMDKMSPKAASKLQVMFDDLGFERFHVSEPVKRTRRMIGVDTTADRPCCCQPCKKNFKDENESESSLSVHFISHHELVSRGGLSPVVSRPKTTDEGHQMFSSPFKSPDLSNSQIQQLPNQPCCCTPKNNYSDSLLPLFYLDRSVPRNAQVLQNQNLFNQSDLCNSKYNLSTDYVRHSFANNVEPFAKVTQEQLQNIYRDKILYSDYIPVATIKSQDLHYRALSNLNTAHINSHVDTTKEGYNSLSNKQLEVVKISLRNSNKMCPLTCKHNQNVPNIRKHSNKMSGNCNAGNYNHISRMPKLFLKNPNVICPTTCNHIDGFKRGAIPDKCNQGTSVGNHDEVKQTTFPDKKMDKLRDLKTISLKNPNRICPPTCRHVNENMDPDSAVHKIKTCRLRPPSCNHVLAETTCDKQDPESRSATNNVNQVKRTPRRICPPTCSRAERLIFEELQTRQPDNVPFSLVPVPLPEGQTVDTGTCHDEVKQTTFPDNKMDKLQDLKTILLKNPNRICPPTCRHVNENMDPDSAVHKIKTCRPGPHGQAETKCAKQDPESGSATNNVNQVKRTPRRICPPTCSRAERLSFEELQTRQPDNVPFSLVPVPLPEDQTVDTVSRHGILCAPRCGKPPSLEKLECEQKQLQMRKRLRETMGDAWPQVEPGGTVVIGNENIDNQIECTCGSKKSKKSKNEKDCECNTIQKIKRKKKCFCGDFIPPLPKIAPDLPPLPPMPRAPSAESTQTDEPFSLFKRSSSGSINLRDEIMLQTEHTQAVSGFKVSNRGNVMKDFSYKEGDLFYDDALVYFDGDIPPEIEVLFETGPWERPPGSRSHIGNHGSRRGAFGMPLEGHDACSCEDKETFLKESMCPEEYEKLKKRHKCECPLKSELPPEELEDVTEAGAAGAIGSGPPGSGMGAIKNGLKFAIGGKGTGSKGLSGICCFDLSVDGNATLSDDLSNNDYIIYTD